MERKDKNQKIFIKNYKKNKCLTIILIMSLLVFLFLHCKTTSYAYTQEEIEAAKAWLSANGYSPDAGGAAQAYQDYLNGKFSGETAEENTSSESQTAEENTSSESQTGQENSSDSADVPSGEINTANSSNHNSENENKGKNKPKNNESKQSDSSQTTPNQNVGQSASADQNQEGGTQPNNGQEGREKSQTINQQTDAYQTQSTNQQVDIEALKQMGEALEQLSKETNQTVSVDNLQENVTVSDNHEAVDEMKQDETLSLDKAENKKKRQKAFMIWALSFAAVVIVIGIIYYCFHRKQ